MLSPRPAVLPVALILVLCCGVYAQTSKTGTFDLGDAMLSGGSPFELVLLRMPHVQAEVNLTDEQRQSLKDELAEAMISIRESLEAVRSLPRDQRQAEQIELKRRSYEVEERVLASFLASLSRGQRFRLRELKLQLQGGRALIDPDVARALQLTDEQVLRARELLRAEELKLQSITAEQQKNSVGFIEVLKAASELRKETGAELLSILSGAQREQMEQLKGEKFEFLKQPPGSPQRD